MREIVGSVDSRICGLQAPHTKNGGELVLWDFVVPAPQANNGGELGLRDLWTLSSLGKNCYIWDPENAFNPGLWVGGLGGGGAVCTYMVLYKEMQFVLRTAWEGGDL